MELKNSDRIVKKGHFSSLSAFMREATKEQKLDVFSQASKKACEAQHKMLERAQAAS